MDSSQDGPLQGDGVQRGIGIRWIHQIALKGFQNRLGAVFGVQLAQQPGDAVLGGFNGEVQLIGNLLIAEALAKTPQHVLFPQAQHVAEGWPPSAEPRL